MWLEKHGQNCNWLLQFTVLEPPRIPIQKAGPRRMVCIVGFGLVGLFGHLVWILFGPGVMGLLQLILKNTHREWMGTEYKDAFGSDLIYSWKEASLKCVAMISDAHFHTDDALVNRFRDAEFSYRLAQGTFSGCSVIISQWPPFVGPTCLMRFAFFILSNCFLMPSSFSCQLPITTV